MLGYKPLFVLLDHVVVELVCLRLLIEKTFLQLEFLALIQTFEVVQLVFTLLVLLSLNAGLFYLELF